MNSFGQSHLLLNELILFLKSNLNDSYNSNNNNNNNDIINLIKLSENNLIKPNPLKRNPLNINDRQAIQSGKISKYPTIELNDDQKNAILEFSDEFELNELECLSLWIEVSDSSKRRLLESQLNKQYGSLDHNIPKAVRELFYFKQDCELNTVIELMKARNDRSLNPSKRNVIMKETNSLLRAGVAFNIMENLLVNFRQGGQNILKLVKQQGGNQKTQNLKNQIAWKQVQTRLLQQAECLFYIYYQTQINIKEHNKLLELIQVLSELIILKEQSASTTSSTSTSTFDSNNNNSNNNNSNNNNSNNNFNNNTNNYLVIPNEWLDGLYQILVVLQLTHVCSLDQIQTLYSRNNDNEPYHTSIVGNEIQPQQGGYDGMDKDKWKNGMVQGFTCLVFAILRQPYIDVRDPAYSPDDVYYFLTLASQLQAYSYIRLCMLPVLQTLSLSSNETSTQSLYISVLSSFIHNLLTIFCLPVYDHLGFPFPDSKLKYTQDIQWSIQEYEKQEQNILSNGSSEDIDYLPISPPVEYYASSKLLIPDSLDDVLALLASILLANPHYPSAFWIPGKYHPFTSRVLQGVTNDSSLILPSLHFLTGLSNGLNLSTCETVYHFLNQKHTGFFDWNRFFLLIKQYADDLSTYSNSQLITKSNENQNINTINTINNNLGNLNNNNNNNNNNNQNNNNFNNNNNINNNFNQVILSDEDSDVLEGIINLIGSVMKHPNVTFALINDGLDPINILFSLFVCRIGNSLKGTILRTISSICASTSTSYQISLTLGSSVLSNNSNLLESNPLHKSIGGKIVEQIWNSIEQYRLLPFSNFSINESGGIYNELESVETVSGNYCVTDGFLELLYILLQHEYGIPVNLGYGYRIPGIICYIDYIISEILMKMHLRSYSNDTHGQQWKINSQVILILVTILQNYPVNLITIEDLIQAKNNPKNLSSNETKTTINEVNTPSSLFQNKSQLFNSLIEDFIDLDGFYPIETQNRSNSQLDLRNYQLGSINSSSILNGVGSSISGGGNTNGGVGLLNIRPTNQYIKRNQNINSLQKIPKPKSAGFAVMCHLLHNSRKLFDHLINILKQNSPQSLILSRDEEINRKCHISVEILKGIYDENIKINKVKELYERKKINKIGYGNNNNIGNIGNNNNNNNNFYNNYNRQNDTEYMNSDLELPQFGWDSLMYDIAYWKYRTVASILGLFYEITLREKIFLTCVRLSSSSSPLTILRTEKVNEPPIILSVQLTELSSSLAGVLNGQPLTEITNFITLLPESVITYPSLPVLSVRILQYVASSQIPSKILNTLYNSLNGEQIISVCTNALVNGNDSITFTPINQYYHLIKRYGGGSNDNLQSIGLIFTPSLAYTTNCGISSYSYYFNSLSLSNTTTNSNININTIPLPPLTTSNSTSSTISNIGGGNNNNNNNNIGIGISSTINKQSLSINSFDDNLNNIFKENNDIREAILDLLLQTLYSNKSCLSHYLLGLLDGVDSILGGKNSIEYRTSLTSFISRGYHMRPGFPMNCLDAVIDLISCNSSTTTTTTNILYLNPQQATKCYELLYRLCLSKLTSNNVFKILWLRRESPNYAHFFQPHIERFLSYYSSSSSIKNKQIVNSHILDDSARINCCAWILKTISLELHSIELSAKEIIPQSTIQALLNLFFDPESKLLQSNLLNSNNINGFGSGSNNLGVKSNQNILLLQILNSLPFNVYSNQLDGYDSPIGIQCMKQSTQLYRVSYGIASENLRNEPPGQFSYININHFINLFQEILLSSTGSTSGSTKSIELQIESAIKVAIDYNKYNILLASLSNLCHGWRQFVDVSFLGCGSLLVGQYNSDWNIFEKSSKLSIEQTNSNSMAIAKLVNFLILPLLNILISQPSLEMILAEQLARSLLSMIALLRDVCSNIDEKNNFDQSINFSDNGFGKSILSPNLHESILTSVIQAIIRRGTSQISRSHSSITYRGYLYTCLIHLLRCNENTSSSTKFSGYDVSFNSNDNEVKEFRIRCMVLLEPYAIDLIDITANDAALNSPNDIISRISAFSVLGSILSIIGPCVDKSNLYLDTLPVNKKNQQYRDSHYGTSAYIQALYSLRDRGHLKKILFNVGLITSSTTSSSSSSFDVLPGLLEATLTLCSHIACCQDGANMLMEYGVINGINSLPIIPLPSNRLNQENSQDLLFSLSNDSNSNYNNNGNSNNSNNLHTEEDIQMILEPILRFLNAMCASSPCYEVLKQCCQFLTQNYHIISYFLHFKSSSLKGLSMIHLIVNLICLIVSATTSIKLNNSNNSNSNTTTTPANNNNNNNELTIVSIWESEMGPKGDIYTSELCRLVRIFGSKPIQNWNYVSVSSRNETQRTDRDVKASWWNVIKPTSAYEEKLNETSCEPPLCLKNEFFKSGGRLNSNQWSSFDSIKFFLGLNILERLSSYFRIRCNLNVRFSSKHNDLNNTNNNNGINNEIGLLAINITDISYSFQSISSFYLKIFNSLDEINNNSNNNNNNNGGNNNTTLHSKWLTESNTLSSPFTPSISNSHGNGNGNNTSINNENSYLFNQMFHNSFNLSQTNEIKKLLLYSIESLLCVLYDLLLLYSSEEEYEQRRGINFGSNRSNISSITSSDWKTNYLSDIIQCLNITESFPTHSFIRQLSRYIHQMISYDQFQSQNSRHSSINYHNHNHNNNLSNNTFGYNSGVGNNNNNISKFNSNLFKNK